MGKHTFIPVVFCIAVAAPLAACDDATTFATSRNDCVAHVARHVMDKNKRRIPDSLMPDFERMNRQMAENACDVIVSECQPRPNGEMCRRLVSDYL